VVRSERLQFDGPRSQIYSIIAPILQQAGLAAPDMRELVITEKSVVEKSTYDELSQAIIGNDIPKITTPLRLDHYTEGPAFRNILYTGELHLHALSHRLSQGEFIPFAWEHGFMDMLEQTESQLNCCRMQAPTCSLRHSVDRP